MVGSGAGKALRQEPPALYPAELGNKIHTSRASKGPETVIVSSTRMILNTVKRGC